MKKILFIILIHVPFVIWGQAYFTFEVKGYTGAGVQAKRADLVYFLEDKVIKDSTMIVNGKFSFKGKLLAPTKAYLSFSNPRAVVRQNDYVTLYLEDGITELHVKHFLSKATFKSGPASKAYQSLVKATKIYTNREKEIVDYYRRFTIRQKMDNKWWTEQDILLEKNRGKKKATLKKFILSHPATIVSLDALMEYASPRPDNKEIYQLFMKLDPSVRNTVPGVAYANQLAKALLPYAGRKALLQ